MKLRLLLLIGIAITTVTVASAPLAGASPPQPVTITIAETFHTTPPFVTGAITATGGVFGEETFGTLASVAFKRSGGRSSSRRTTTSSSIRRLTSTRWGAARSWSSSRPAATW